MKYTRRVRTGAVAILLIAAVSLLLSRTGYMPPAVGTSNTLPGRATTGNGLGGGELSLARLTPRTGNSDRWQGLKADRSSGEVKDRALMTAQHWSDTFDAREVELRLQGGNLDSSTAMTIAESLVHARSQDTAYASEVAAMLAVNLENSRSADRNDALELAYLTLIQRLLDDGNAEAAQYIAERALDEIPDSTRVRSSLAIALAERLYYREAIDVLLAIQQPDATVGALIATLLYRQGDIVEATRLASELRGWSADAAEMMEEIPE